MHIGSTPLLALLLLAGTGHASELPCASEAREQAARLLSFHTDGDDRAEIDQDLRELPSLRNPANAAQSFRVLEVRGHVYKARYRLRLLYADLDGECVLMGQEVLEHASL